METISECIRKYVEAHDNEVTSCEVINYILKEKKFETTEKIVRATLTRILKEVGGKLKPKSSVKAEIRSYVKAHNNEVTSCEVINYILEERQFTANGKYIRDQLTRVLKEVGGKLKPQSSVTAEIRSYVKAHNNEVTSCEVINYILKEKGMNTTEGTIKRTLWKVVRESGGEYSICSKKNNCNK